jgi:site-specific DNA-methyltransferase (adenine-specific)
MTPYYQDDACTIYHGDCRQIAEKIDFNFVVTDPPYGIDYCSGHEGSIARSIEGDKDTSLRDFAISLRPDCACFATWQCVPPSRPRAQLIWSKPTIGMGDLSFPFGLSYEIVWVFGSGWAGRRMGSVLTGETIVTWNTGPARRLHPHQKPVGVMSKIIERHEGVFLDPFMGSGTTLVAAKLEGRRAVGIELEERYCEIAANRLSQGVLF